MTTARVSVAASVVDPPDLLGSQGRMSCVRLVVLVAGLLVAVAAADAAALGRTVGGHGISVALPAGWHGLSAPGQLQAADFPLTRRARVS